MVKRFDVIRHERTEDRENRAGTEIVTRRVLTWVVTNNQGDFVDECHTRKEALEKANTLNRSMPRDERNRRPIATVSNAR